MLGVLADMYPTTMNFQLEPLYPLCIDVFFQGSSQRLPTINLLVYVYCTMYKK